MGGRCREKGKEVTVDTMGSWLTLLLFHNYQHISGRRAVSHASTKMSIGSLHRHSLYFTCYGLISTTASALLNFCSSP